MIVQNLSATARQTIHACKMQLVQYFGLWPFHDTGDILYLDGRKGIGLNLIVPFDILQQVDIIIELEIRMNAALQEDTRTAPGQQFFDFFADLLVAQQVTLWTGRLAIESAEAAVDDADVGVVDVAVYQEGDDPFRVAALANSIGGSS